MALSRRTLLAASAMVSALSATRASATPAPDGYWPRIMAQYDRPKDIIMLENGNWGVMARPVLSAYEKALEKVNRDASYYTRRDFPAEAKAILQRLGTLLRAEDGELAFTRNASEALQALISGYNTLKPGDHVLYADHDYDSMQNGFEWLRQRRDVMPVKIALPEPATYQNLIDCYEAALKKDRKIRLILLTHIGHRSGLMLPVREITALARARGVDVLVDAAHSWGQVDFTIPDMGADFIGFNLHKWIGAPLGVGLVYIRKNRLTDIDPYMAGPEAARGGIFTRVHTGTMNFAAILAVADALDFHLAIGPARKAARLRALRDLWAETLRGHPGIDILTPADPRLGAGITAFRLKGHDDVAANVADAQALLDQHRIFTVMRDGLAHGACVRVTPALFNSEDDIARLTGALRTLADKAAK